MKIRELCVLSLALGMTAWAWAQGKNPPKAESKKENDMTFKDAKDGTNRALDALEKDLKQGARKAKAGTNKALQSVDDAIHDRK